MIAWVDFFHEKENAEKDAWWFVILFLLMISMAPELGKGS